MQAYSRFLHVGRYLCFEILRYYQKLTQSVQIAVFVVKTCEQMSYIILFMRKIHINYILLLLVCHRIVMTHGTFMKFNRIVYDIIIIIWVTSLNM